MPPLRTQFAVTVLALWLTASCSSPTVPNALVDGVGTGGTQNPSPTPAGAGGSNSPSTSSGTGGAGGGLVARPFRVFDATLFSDKPLSLETRGFPPFKIVYTGALWPEGAPMDEPDEAQIRLRAREVMNGRDTTDNLVMLDIEHWPTCGSTTDRERTESLEKLGLAAQWFRAERPDLLVGLYSLPPCRDYWSATSRDRRKFAAWQSVNDELRPLVKQLDASYPSLYTFYDDRVGWEAYARSNIAEAQRASGGKPVIPILWMEYHDSNAELAGTVLPDEFWRLQLETVRDAGADSVIVWGGWTLDWDEEAGWWKETQAFVGAL